MRKKLRNIDEVVHYWANQVQYEGEAGSVFFDGTMIFSYGRHFCMARILDEGVVAITNRSYSVTTSGHVSRVRQGARHYRQIVVHDPAASAGHNIDYAREEIVRLLEQAKNKRIKETTRLRLKEEAYNLAVDANRFLELLPEDGVLPIDTDKLELIKEEIKAARKLKIEQAERQQERRIQEAQRDLAEWRNHGFTTYRSFHSIPPALRMSMGGEFVETSHGAEIPVGEAKRLWRLICAVRAAGRDFITTRRLGHYSLTLVRADGSIVVGCHDIAYSEVEGIAKQLDLIVEAA